MAACAPNITSLSSPVDPSGDQNTPNSLYFYGGTGGADLQTGRFYQVGATLSWTFYWEGWIKPVNDGSHYWLIDSSSGAHAIEIGFQVSPPGQNIPAGFINSSPTGTTSVGWGCDEPIYDGEWAHVALYGDGTYLYSTVNGILCGTVAVSGTRQTYNVLTNGTGTISVGGTNHNNYTGALGFIRGWEGYSPLAYPTQAFVPEKFATSNSYRINGFPTFQPPNLLLDLTTLAQGEVPDLSPIGFNGVGGLAIPAAPTLVVTGGDTTTRSYALAELVGDETTPASLASTTTVAPAVLDATHTVALSWTPNPRATGAQVWRTAPLPAGLLGTVPAGVGSFVDTGFPAVALELPKTNYTSGGRLHPGTFDGSLPSSTNDDGFGNNGKINYPVPVYVYDDGAPWAHEAAPPTPNAFPIVPHTVPIGALVFDDFERQDSTYAFTYSPSLGSTVAGASLGSLTWQPFIFPGYGGGPSVWGIQHGLAHFLDTRQAGAVVNVGQADMDIQVTRRSSSRWVIPNATQTGLIGRYQDGNNFWYAYVYGSISAPICRIGNFVGGGNHFELQFALPANPNWHAFRVTFVGDTITVYTGLGTLGAWTWTQANQFTNASVDTGTYAGLAMMSTAGNGGVTSASTYGDFGVY